MGFHLKYLRIYLGILLLTSSYLLGYSQSLNGSTGLLRIPTAKFQDDRTLIIGASFLNKDLLAYSNYQYDAIAGYATITFLPFLEVAIRYTRKIDMPSIEYETREFADRMPSIKLRLLKENKYIPAIAIGGNDFITSVKGRGPHYFASYFVVGSKKILLKKELVEADLSLGYAFKIGDPAHYEILGWFGGICLSPTDFKNVSALIDYDSRYWNIGLRLLLFKHLQIMPVLRKGEIFEGNIAYRIYL